MAPGLRSGKGANTRSWQYPILSAALPELRKTPNHKKDDYMGVLNGIKVLDLSTLFAGPFAATLLGDHGAEVSKVEHPRGDEARNWGKKKNGIPLWWKVISRNKKLIAIDLHEHEGRKIVRDLVKDTDVLIENFRPGKMESWGLGWNELHSLNKKLIMVRMSGFGQTGPYGQFAGFGTLAESISGFAYTTGDRNGPPTLPAFGLADGIAGLAGAFAAVSALYRRSITGQGEMIDVAIYEPLMWIVGAHIIEYDQLGLIQKRTGNQSSRVVPRNTYLTKDGKWIAISSTAESIARRLFDAIGRPELIRDPKFSTNEARLKNREFVNKIISEWMKEHTLEEALMTIRNHEAAAAPVYNAEHIVNDQHFRLRKSIMTVPDEDLGSIMMQGIFPIFLNSPGEVRWPGKIKIGADTDEIMKKLGYSSSRIERLRKRGVIA